MQLSDNRFTYTYKGMNPAQHSLMQEDYYALALDQKINQIEQLD